MSTIGHFRVPKNPHLQNEARCTTVEGLNVINDPKCNKVLNVITFVLNVIES